MRTIKFRGKRIDNGEWVYGDLLTNRKEPEILAYKGQYSVDKSTIGEYTGLVDKNGKEIYEGDVIESGFRIRHELYYDEKGASFKAACDGDRKYLSGGLYQEWIDEFGKEVIGNIHDNPELLK